MDDEFILLNLLTEKHNAINAKDLARPDLLVLVISSNLWYVHKNMVIVVFNTVPAGTSKL